jgi:hypothetical protein
MTEQTAATQTPAAQAAATQAAAAPASQKAASAPAIKGDVRAGVGFWSMGTMVAGIASDLAKPVANLAPYLFGVFLFAAGVCAWLAFFRKPPMQVARTLFGTMAIGAAVFGFFLIAPMLAGSEGKDRGIIAAVVPPVAAVQTAVLPLSDTERQLLTFGTKISTGDPEARSAAAREALSDPKQDKPTRRAMLERILRNSDPNVQQAGLVSAMRDRGRGAIPVLPDRSSNAPLAVALAGSTVEFYSVNEDTGAVSGMFHTAGGTRGFTGSIANGRLVITVAVMIDSKWAPGNVIDVAVDNRLQLVGDARSQTGDSVKVEMPIL